MRGRGLPGFEPGSIGLSILLLVVVIAFPLLAAATESDHISVCFTKDQNQRGWGPYKSPSLAIGGTQLEPSKVIAQATTGGRQPDTSRHSPDTNGPGVMSQEAPAAVPRLER